MRISDWSSDVCSSDLYSDERLTRWRAEAVGYKIRYVPATLPDLLKSEEIISFEYSRQGSSMPAIRLEQAESRLAYSRRPETDLEACSSLQSLQGFARGQGIWDKQIGRASCRARVCQYV